MRTAAPLLALLLTLSPLAACLDSGAESGAVDDTTTVEDTTTADDTTTTVDDTIEQDTAVVTLREPERHRAEAIECDDVRATTPPSIPDGDYYYVECTSHDECTEGDNGRCVGNTHDGWYCTYDQCFSDADCDNVCECGGGFRSDHNVCLSQGNCLVDADCGEGGWCSPTLGSCGDYIGTVAYYCHTAEDECVDDADCEGDPDNWGAPYCAYNTVAGKWMCDSSHCVGVSR